MSAETLHQLFDALDAAIQSEDGQALKLLLKLDPSTHPNGELLVKFLPSIDIDEACEKGVDPRFNETVAGHLKALVALQQSRMEEAYSHISPAYIKFLPTFQSEGKWLVPVLHVLTVDFRETALKADNELSGTGKNLYKKTEECERHLKRGFSLSINDRSPLASSKKWGALAMVNNLFKLYFRLNKLKLCKNLIRAVEGPAFPPFDRFPLAHRVTYKYYVGRLSLLEDKYRRAEEELAFAFAHCHKESVHNKRQTLQFLVPVRMVLGQLPTAPLLRKYSLSQYASLAHAVRVGDIRQFNATLSAHTQYFIKKGVYLVLEKLRLLVYRNLFKRVVDTFGTNKLPLQRFEKALAWCGETMDLDEIECIFANLIYKGYVKGYLSHSRRYLVLSKQTPFPPLKQLLSAQ